MFDDRRNATYHNERQTTTTSQPARFLKNSRDSSREQRPRDLAITHESSRPIWRHNSRSGFSTPAIFDVGETITCQGGGGRERMEGGGGGGRGDIPNSTREHSLHKIIVFIMAPRTLTACCWQLCLGGLPQPSQLSQPPPPPPTKQHGPERRFRKI